MKAIRRSIVAFCVAVVGAATQAGGQLPTTIAVGTMVRIHHPRTIQQRSVARVLRIRGDSIDLTFSGYLPSGRPYARDATYAGAETTVLWTDVDVVVGFDTHRGDPIEEGLIGGPLGGALIGFLVARSCPIGCLDHAQTRDMVKAGAAIGLVAGAIHAVVGGSQNRTLRWGPSTGVQAVAIEPGLIKQRPSLMVSVPF
jgi:hypothetical protein